MPTGQIQAAETAEPPAGAESKKSVVAWLLCLVFYNLEYASRSSPSVMVPELAKAFSIASVAVTALLGTYY